VRIKLETGSFRFPTVITDFITKILVNPYLACPVVTLRNLFYGFFVLFVVF